MGICRQLVKLSTIVNSGVKSGFIKDFIQKAQNNISQVLQHISSSKTTNESVYIKDYIQNYSKATDSNLTVLNIENHLPNDGQMLQEAKDEERQEGGTHQQPNNTSQNIQSLLYSMYLPGNQFSPLMTLEDKNESAIKAHSQANTLRSNLAIGLAS